MLLLSETQNSMACVSLFQRGKENHSFTWENYPKRLTPDFISFSSHQPRLDNHKQNFTLLPRIVVRIKWNKITLSHTKCHINIRLLREGNWYHSRFVLEMATTNYTKSPANPPDRKCVWLLNTRWIPFCWATPARLDAPGASVMNGHVLQGLACLAFGSTLQCWLSAKSGLTSPSRLPGTAFPVPSGLKLESRFAEHKWPNNEIHTRELPSPPLSPKATPVPTSSLFLICSRAQDMGGQEAKTRAKEQMCPTEHSSK